MINEFLAKGGLFTFASARSFFSASRITRPLNLTLPVAVYNGSFLMDPVDGRELWGSVLQPDAALAAIDTMATMGISPIVYTYMDGQEKASWLNQVHTPGQMRYIAAREGDVRNRLVDDVGALLAGSVFYMMTIQNEQTADALCGLLQGLPGICLHTLEDSYSPGDYWVEVSSPEAGKDKAVRHMKEITGADRVVCFGDNLNDIVMFEACDAGYAVANAKAELKAIADGVIGSNMEDGVARFIRAVMDR